MARRVLSQSRVLNIAQSHTASNMNAMLMRPDDDGPRPDGMLYSSDDNRNNEEQDENLDEQESLCEWPAGMELGAPRFRCSKRNWFVGAPMCSKPWFTFARCAVS